MMNANGKIPCVLMDIDGTLADIAHRLPLLPPPDAEPAARSAAWEAFFDACEGDTPHEELIWLNNLIHSRIPVFMVTGRPANYRTRTQAWFTRHGVLHNGIHMRQEGDHRPDHVVKKELLDQIRADGWEPIFAVDDRDIVVKMWRENGVRCLHVAEGNF